jgi:hypothetical protein
VEDRFGYFPGFEALSIGFHCDFHIRLSRARCEPAKLLAEVKLSVLQARIRVAAISPVTKFSELGYFLG